MEILQPPIEQMKSPSNWTRLDLVLKAIFKHPAVLAVIAGEPNSGKTDFALLIAERLLERGVITTVASNIETRDPRVEWVSSLEKLRYWLYMDQTRKLYILDEAIVNLPSRASMSRQNVEMLKIIPEIRKAHARIIIVAQNPKRADHALLDEVWLKALFVKRSQTFVHIISNFLKQPEKITDIPPTNIKFDSFSSAPFTLHEVDTTWRFGTEKDRVVKAWADGQSTREIEKTVSYKTVYAWAREILQEHYRSCKLQVTHKGERISNESATVTSDHR